jgi:hypothetical protein
MAKQPGATPIHSRNTSLKECHIGRYTQALVIGQGCTMCGYAAYQYVHVNRCKCVSIDAYYCYACGLA